MSRAEGGHVLPVSAGNPTQQSRGSFQDAAGGVEQGSGSKCREVSPSMIESARLLFLVSGGVGYRDTGHAIYADIPMHQ